MFFAMSREFFFVFLDVIFRDFFDPSAVSLPRGTHFTTRLLLSTVHPIFGVLRDWAAGRATFCVRLTFRRQAQNDVNIRISVQVFLSAFAL